MRVIPTNLMIGEPKIVCCPACKKPATVYENGCLSCSACTDGQPKTWTPLPGDGTAWAQFLSFASRTGVDAKRLSAFIQEVQALTPDPVEIQVRH